MAAGLPGRVHAGGEKLAGAAGGQHYVVCREHSQATIRLVEALTVECQCADDAAVVPFALGQQTDDFVAVEDRYLGVAAFLQRCGKHLHGGSGPGGGGALAGVMVGLIADMGAIAIAWELHAVFDQMEEGRCRSERLDVGDIAVAHAALEKRARHIHGAVEGVAEDAQLVVGLLI